MPERGSALQQRAWKDLTGHRWWGYRACAPADGAPGMARADRTVPLTVWVTPDGERQRDRLDREETALALCGRCPMRTQCLDYALGGDDGPYEPWDIWGGMTAHQRADLLSARKATADVPARTQVVVSDLDTAVLKALAAHRSPQAVARAAGMTLTRANWHRSCLVTQLNLDPRTTTRMRLIYTARLLGLLDPAAPYLADRTRLIAAVPSRQPALVRSRGVQLVLPGMRLDRLVLRPTQRATVCPLPAAGTPATTLEMAA